jgi:hypothetical protein
LEWRRKLHKKSEREEQEEAERGKVPDTNLSIRDLVPFKHTLGCVIG